MFVLLERMNQFEQCSLLCTVCEKASLSEKKKKKHAH